MSKFDAIRPFYETEVNDAIQNVVHHPMMKALMNFTFPDLIISVCYRIVPAESSSVQIRFIHRTYACPFKNQAQHTRSRVRIEFELIRRKEW